MLTMWATLGAATLGLARTPPREEKDDNSEPSQGTALPGPHESRLDTARPRGHGHHGGGPRVRLDRCVSGGRLHLRRRQHRPGQYHRRVRRHADGSLTPLAGSPFSAGGAGLGAGLASQGAIQVTADGKYLLAVDAGSNQISVLRITAGGVPVLAGQPVPSGGIKPVSVAVSRFGLVYVANQGNGGSGYSGFACIPEGT
jgi:hypothetical protein